MYRKTQHQNWLLQKRAEVFGELLRTLEECNDETSKYLRESPPNGFERNQRIQDFYQPALYYAKVARLFIKDESKDKIEKLVSQIYAAHSTVELGSKRAEIMVKSLKEIQTILEENLRNPKW